jgi:tetratricopeptide (TPR) repeat protein
MFKIQTLAGLSVMLLLVGCAAMGVVATSDPDVKLSDAQNLYRNLDRPLPAETLISEAIEIYQKQGNLRGLGNAYREYGGLLLSPSLTKWGSPKMYFHDPSVTYENRVAKASDYFRKALDAYEKFEPQPLEAKQYDVLSNLYYVTAWTYNGLHDHKNSCKYFDKSLAAYAENIRLNPSAKPISPGFNSFPEMVTFYEKQIGLDCNS